MIRRIIAEMLIGIHNVPDMASPHHAVAWCDQADIQPLNHRNGFLHLHAVGHEYVGVIFLRLRHYLGHIHFIIITPAAGIMLAEGIVGEQDLFLRAVGNHIIGPVKHGRRHKLQRMPAKAQGISRLYRHIFIAVAVMQLQSVVSAGSACDNHCMGRLCHYRRDCSGMVHLHMVGYQIVNLFRIYDFPDTLKKLLGKGLFHRVYQGDFLINDEIGVIGGASVGRIAMKAAHIPVHHAYRINAGS